MATISKTLIATGASSGLGFELVKQLLQQSQPYKLILAARDTQQAQAAYDALQYDSSTHKLTILPAELSNLKTVKSFAEQALEKLGNDRLDYVMLNAGMFEAPGTKGPEGSKWSNSYLVNHLSQHYLTHLLRPKIEQSHSRVVVVSSGAVRGVKDTSALEEDMLSGADKTPNGRYSASKFIQLLGAHWWRRQLGDNAVVVAVSPGLIPGTGINRNNVVQMPDNLPDAKSVPEGAQSIYAAFVRDDLPKDTEQIFLTSWGEWWAKDVYGLSLDKALQDKWSPGKEEIEREAGINN
ncbi:uncharacterized protein B0I36DRAFT_328053 [Microdochium trichocladiopsis]|uniref:Uncharacterized protein n=1 Tax=Microdochium trichocladiopsis TaxID=1682393 RepID=A0A9P8Y2T5_9PEZI|nr:uncharacterized protein B0I36DRAFT_328053 [Microdochium trichocladiopsis]KAH7027858.1 hypothetical protein B0I36DRAFT_328053 [Microdochium trichocladiopsis]